MASAAKPIPATSESALSIEQHRAFLEKAQDVARIGSWVVEFDGSNRLSWSAEMYRIFGIADGEFRGTFEAFLDLVHADDVAMVRAASIAARHGDQPFDVEHRILTGTGRIRWIHAKAEVIRDAAGRPILMIGTAQDSTDRRQLELQLRHFQKTEAIGRLAGGIAHDFNNALTTIVGYTEHALGLLSSDHPAHADVEEIRRAAARAESVTRQLLTYSRREATELTVFDLNAVVVGLARLLERALGNNVLFRTILAPTLPSITAERGQIEQAIVNLAANARDAMPGGGELCLRTTLEEVDEAGARAHEPMPVGRYVVLSVTDTGHGFDRETKERIFEPFFTTKAVGEGTGLGLAMVYGSVKQNGGFIFAESEVGRGTTFRLYFPAIPGSDGAATVRPESVEAPDKPTVLLVEDESSILNLVAASLSSEGYQLLKATSGQDALNVAAAFSRPLDLVLTDARMPNMSGVDLARRLLQLYPNVAVVLMSGYSAEDLTRFAGPDHPIGYLQKPFTPSQVRAKVRTTLNQRRRKLADGTVQS